MSLTAPLFDVIVPVPTNERRPTYVFLNGAFDRAENEPRPYQWGFVGDRRVRVRTTMPERIGAYPAAEVRRPRFGDLVDVHLDASPCCWEYSVRVARHSGRQRPLRHRREPRTEAEMHDWVTTQMRLSGLVPLDIRAAWTSSLIARPPDQWTNIGVLCTGVATVFDDDAARAACALGVGNAKVFGYGLLVLTKR